MIEASADPTEFREAVEWFAKKLALTKDEWEQLTLEARRKAFTVANVTEAELVSGVKDSLKRAIEEGQSFATWKKQIGPALEEAWGGERPWQLETIFRTNVQGAYGAGRYAQLTDPDVLEARPYWMFDAIMDGRTTPECATLHGTVLLATDRWWDGRIPPLHFNCRSSIRSLDEEQAKEQPKFGQAEKPSQRGSDGFGWKPDQNEWEPDTSKYEEQIRRELKMRLAHGPDESQLPRREPPVAITGPLTGSDAPRGGQWSPGSVRSDATDPEARVRVGQPPWHMDEELRPRGETTAERGAKKPETHEAAIDEYLEEQGNSLVRLPEGSTKQRENFADRNINGIEVEYASVFPQEETLRAQKALSRAVEKKAGKRQARYLIVDLRMTQLTYEQAIKALSMDNTARASKEFVALRLIGKTFDVTIYPS